MGIVSGRTSTTTRTTASLGRSKCLTVSDDAAAEYFSIARRCGDGESKGQGHGRGYQLEINAVTGSEGTFNHDAALGYWLQLFGRHMPNGSEGSFGQTPHTCRRSNAVLRKKPENVYAWLS